jgi:putative membrane protein
MTTLAYEPGVFNLGAAEIARGLCYPAGVFRRRNDTVMTTSPSPPTSNDVAQPRPMLTDDRTSLALDRTRLAHERTLMAWVRTAVSLISFGFTIYKFFQGLTEAREIAAPHHLVGPRGFALVMIGLGVGSLVLATLQHRSEMKALAAEYTQYGPLPRSTSQIVASVVGVLGLIALTVVILRQ